MLSGYIYYWQVYIGVQKIDSPAAQLFLARDNKVLHSYFEVIK